MQRQRNGFTLVELMVVIAIIGVIAAIAVPNFIRFQARSRRAEVTANLKAFAVAEKSYYAEKDTFVPFVQQVGYLPERGNRFAYFSNNSENYVLRTSAAGDAKCPTCDAISVDTFKHGGIAAKPGFGSQKPGLEGGVPCPDCKWNLVGTGNIDEDSDLDEWLIVVGTAGATGFTLPSGAKAVTNEPIHMVTDL